jgi:hypothetical protein
MRSTFRNLLLVSGAVLASLVAGCGESGTPLSPDRASAPAFAKPGSEVTALSAPATDLEVLARFKVKPQITIAWAKAWIGPAGGRVDFEGFTLIVPAGAVDKTTMFSIRLPVDPQGSEHVVAEFGPHQTFARPLTIGFPYRNTTVDGQSAQVVWWDGAWVSMGGTVSADGTQIFTETTHFSEFGVAPARGGGLLTSGG